MASARCSRSTQQARASCRAIGTASPHLDPLAAALAKRLRVTDAILDGEVICADNTGRPIFLDLSGCGGSFPVRAFLNVNAGCDASTARPSRWVGDGHALGNGLRT
jgi:hypothetical protein